MISQLNFNQNDLRPILMSPKLLRNIFKTSAVTVKLVSQNRYPRGHCAGISAHEIRPMRWLIGGARRNIKQQTARVQKAGVRTRERPEWNVKPPLVEREIRI